MFPLWLGGTKCSEKAKRAEEIGRPWRRVPTPLPSPWPGGCGWQGGTGGWCSGHTALACSEISCRNIHGQRLDGVSTPIPLKGRSGASLGLEFRAERTIHTHEDRIQIRWSWHWYYPVSPWPHGSKTASFLSSIPEPVSCFLALMGSCCHFVDFVLPWLFCVCVIRDGNHLKTASTWFKYLNHLQAFAYCYLY